MFVLLVIVGVVGCHTVTGDTHSGVETYIDSDSLTAPAASNATSLILERFDVVPSNQIPPSLAGKCTKDHALYCSLSVSLCCCHPVQTPNPVNGIQCFPNPLASLHRPVLSGYSHTSPYPYRRVKRKKLYYGDLTSLQHQEGKNPRSSPSPVTSSVSQHKHTTMSPYKYRLLKQLMMSQSSVPSPVSQHKHTKMSPYKYRLLKQMMMSALMKQKYKPVTGLYPQYGGGLSYNGGEDIYHGGSGAYHALSDGYQLGGGSYHGLGTSDFGAGSSVAYHGGGGSGAYHGGGGPYLAAGGGAYLGGGHGAFYGGGGVTTLEGGVDAYASGVGTSYLGGAGSALLEDPHHAGREAPPQTIWLWKV